MYVFIRTRESLAPEAIETTDVLELVKTELAFFLRLTESVTLFCAAEPLFLTVEKLYY